MKTHSTFYQNKKVLVTGGTGFVGTHLVQALLENGAFVRIPVHRRQPLVKDERIEIVYADLNHLEECMEAMKGIDYVFHAAGGVGAAGVTPAYQLEGISMSLALTSRVLQSAWNAGVERLLFLSSSTVYPAFNHPVKEDEDWAGLPHETYSGYGWMKRYLEKLAEFVASRSCLKIAIVRPTAIYGRWDNFSPETSHVVPALIIRACKKENPFVVWGVGNEVRDFLHITDLARGCLLALEHHAICDPINIGYGDIVTIRQIAEAVLNATGHTEAKVVFEKNKPTTIPFRAVDISKARNLLGFEPRLALDAGIQDTVKWYKNNFGK
ncbi:MAG: NAD-dependent epimerase/dehydratase family protein [Lentisphaerota bacterium]